jgi:hypothetical protein
MPSAAPQGPPGRERDGRGAGGVPVETASPVLKPLAARQSTCAECGVALPAKTGPGRRSTRCDECRGQKRNGQASAPLPDLKPEQRPMRSQDYEKDWLAEQLTPPKLPWQVREGG